MSVLRRISTPITHFRARRPLALLVSLILIAAGVTLVTAGPASAVGAPVLVDNFGGSHLGTRTITPPALPSTSTTPPATFSREPASSPRRWGATATAPAACSSTTR